TSQSMSLSLGRFRADPSGATLGSGDALEPGIRLQALEDLARFGEHRLRLVATALLDEPLGVLQEHNGEEEGRPDLAEEGSCATDPGLHRPGLARACRYQRLEPLTLRFEEGRPVDGAHALPLAEQLLRSTQVARFERSLDTLDERALHEDVTRREPVLGGKRL